MERGGEWYSWSRSDQWYLIPENAKLAHAEMKTKFDALREQSREIAELAASLRLQASQAASVRDASETPYDEALASKAAAKRAYDKAVEESTALNKKSERFYYMLSKTKLKTEAQAITKTLPNLRAALDEANRQVEDTKQKRNQAMNEAARLAKESTRVAAEAREISRKVEALPF
jgi:hypothetical protein